MAINSVNPSFAASLYAKTSGVASGQSGETGDTSGSGDGSGGISFGDMLKSNVADSIQTIKNSEKMSAQAITGKADLTDIVQAVNSAELTLQTVVAVRDRMISAYQDIMRMPI